MNQIWSNYGLKQLHPTQSQWHQTQVKEKYPNNKALQDSFITVFSGS